MAAFHLIIYGRFWVITEVEFFHDDRKGFEWIGVRHVVEVNRWRDSHTDLPAVPKFEHRLDCFSEKADWFAAVPPYSSVR